MDFPERGLFGHASVPAADTDLQCVPAPSTETPRAEGGVNSQAALMKSLPCLLQTNDILWSFQVLTTNTDTMFHELINIVK